MAKVVARKETGKLLIDFTYKGVRCREQTALLDTPANRKRVQAVVDKLTVALKEERFAYGEFFPGSPMAERFATPLTPPQAVVPPNEQTDAPVGPMFEEFADQWVQERSIEWRRSHIRSLLSTLDSRIKPYFGKRAIGSINKADVLAFRGAGKGAGARREARPVAQADQRDHGHAAPDPGRGSGPV